MKEINNTSELKDAIVSYAVRYRHCQPFTLTELHQHFPLQNTVRLGYTLDDMVIEGSLVKVSESFYAGKDTRSLPDKVKSLFHSEYVSYDKNEVARIFKIREDKSEEVLQALVKEGFIERNPFLGGKYWLKV